MSEGRLILSEKPAERRSRFLNSPLGKTPHKTRVIRAGLIAARIALLYIFHMAAEGGRAAVANRLEGLSLTSREHVPPSREEIALIHAEDIGHFGPMFPHRPGLMVLAARTRSSESSSSSGLLMERMLTSATWR